MGTFMHQYISIAIQRNNESVWGTAGHTARILLDADATEFPTVKGTRLLQTGWQQVPSAMRNAAMSTLNQGICCWMQV